MSVIELLSIDLFQSHFSAQKLLVLNFYASWADPCVHMNNVFSELAAKYSEMTFINIEAENYPEISSDYKISSVPTFIVIASKKTISTIEGANAPLLTSTLEKIASSPYAFIPIPASSPPLPIQHLPTVKDLESLITSHTIMVFMKGTPITPKCNFSKKTIELLNSLNVSYGTYNILNNETIRSMLKDYANWPTYPMIFVEGALIGGIDIVSEMITDGSFTSLLPPTPIDVKDDIETRLAKLIKRSKVMLFIKGTPKAPQCGFSAKLIALLTQHEITFDTFDILNDDDVRQGLKKFSNWPTYPQVYVDGELMGGLDIVQEMIEMGEFKV